MDIYGTFDLIAIALACVVAYKMQNSESINLLIFFMLSSLTSLILFQTEYYIYWPVAFTALCVAFGTASYKHPIVLGYAGYLALIGLNAYIPVLLYTELVYSIFAYQLWIVRYGRDHGHYIGGFWASSAHNPRHKSLQKGENR